MITRVNPRPITSQSSHPPGRSGAGGGASGDRVELKVQSDPANLAAVRKAVEQFAVRNGLTERSAADVGLCLNEAMANVTRHAYAGRTDRPVHVSAWMQSPPEAPGSPDELVVTIRDWGNGVDPSKVPHRPYDPLEPGGVGLICLQQCLDGISYQPQPDGGLLTTMRKRKKT